MKRAHVIAVALVLLAAVALGLSLRIHEASPPASVDEAHSQPSVMAPNDAAGHSLRGADSHDGIRSPAEPHANSGPGTPDRLAPDPAAFFEHMARDKAELWIPQVYEDLPRQMNLTPVEFQRLKILLAEQEGESGVPDIAVGEDGQSAEELREQMMARHRAELTELLGEQRMAQFDRYEDSFDARYEVAEMRWAMNGAGVPIGEAVRKELVARMLKPGSMLKVRDFIPGESPRAYRQEAEAQLDLNDQLILSSVRDLLTVEQLRAYQDYQKRRRENVLRSLLPFGTPAKEGNESTRETGAPP